MTPARAWLFALETTARATEDPGRTLPQAVAEWARVYGDAPALLSNSEMLTFRQLAERVNQYSRWALAAGIGVAEPVALIMGNRPEYFAIWLGLTQIGAIVALVSPDLRGPGVAHAIRVAGVRRVVADARCAEVCAQAKLALNDPLEIWLHGLGADGDRRIDLAVAGHNGAPLGPSERRPITLADRALRIFTSGTTGLPKAAEVSHRRLVVWSHWFAGLAGMTASDRLYNCLPMHHSVGGVVAVAAPLVFGGSVAIADRFSVRNFWNDVARWDCTAFQYIGELCRYLVSAPIRSAEREHKIRIAIGNGLAEPVWRTFLERFGPMQILEFYASTEGNVWLYNVEGKIGSLGRAPPYLQLRDSIALARFDYDEGTPARGADGFGIRCEIGEVGEALGRIDADAGGRFEGYSEQTETEKKILRNVFKRGDAWMRTGDLMRRDAEGFYSFVDRVGDTFRWKGENVSTIEVASVLRSCPGVDDALVFGVAVPGAEGRAGMALLKIGRDFDLTMLPAIIELLPKPARPLFLRIVPEIEATETFKPKGRVYVEQGFDRERVDDPLYVLDGERRAYVALDGERHAAICNGAGIF